MTADPTGNYDAAYHVALQAGSRRSAAAVLARVQALVAPSSVVDFGCGSGGWLAEVGALGITDRAGVDGPWVGSETLEIDPVLFISADLSAPLDLGRRFDLALCLEVAEHLPKVAAPIIIDTLCAHAPVVVFSAAIPGQGGEGHVNEAWPSYWRDLFAARGFDGFDVLRAPFWQDGTVEPWYRQNLLIFVERHHLACDGKLARRLRDAIAAPLDIVHPEFFQKHCELAAAYRNLTVAYEQEAARNAALRSSVSWRMTAPLRAIAQRLRGKEAKDA
jgi:SAM-dependent methyltransferase